MTGTRDALNAFLDYPDAAVANARTGPLAGLTFGVKDIFDVAGYPTGGGNPDKLAESGVKTGTMSLVQTLLDAGARFLGKTQTEELTFSMIGMNAHFATPVNARAPDRVTGGSSSGSVAAVAGGLCDFALGSDTNGSIRYPAAFCGLLGLRTTHGRIALDRTMALAPSFDTFGWFAKDAATYERIGDVLLGDDTFSSEIDRPHRIAALEGLLESNAARNAYEGLAERVEATFAGKSEALVMPGEVGELFDCFKQIQAFEAWEVHGPFLEGGDRRLGPGVKERFDYARSISSLAYGAAVMRRERFRREFAEALPLGGVVVLPSQPGPAPLKSSTQDEIGAYRNRALAISAIAGLLGWPQITLPLGTLAEAPFGISLMAPTGSDRQLIALARRIAGDN